MKRFVRQSHRSSERNRPFFDQAVAKARPESSNCIPELLSGDNKSHFLMKKQRRSALENAQQIAFLFLHPPLPLLQITFGKSNLAMRLLYFIFIIFFPSFVFCHFLSFSLSRATLFWFVLVLFFFAHSLLTVSISRWKMIPPPREAKQVGENNDEDRRISGCADYKTRPDWKNLSLDYWNFQKFCAKLIK